ncbi:MAG: M24 family metallopeptidase [Opitutales bacterium]
MKSKSSTLRLLYAASERCADTLYLSGVFVPDPFLSVITKDKCYAVVSRLEYARVRSRSNYDEVMLLETIRKQAAETLGCSLKWVGPGELMQFFAQRFAVKKIEVPEDFPALYYQHLHHAGYNVEVVPAPFFPKRAKKSDQEAAAIKKGNAASAAGLRAAEQVLRDARIEGNRLRYGGKVLTSERLRTIIDQACLERGAVAHHTIAAGGRQACDPHEVGHGPLRPNELIIVDVFPRLQSSGYHGDMTRTFLKGRASSAQRQLVAAVKEAQAAALAEVKHGVKGAAVHQAASECFVARGYATERRGNNFVGFIHSTGHGLGLEVHEAPRVSPGAKKLKAGQVITIEPGLYYPEIGGCRIEDVVRVTEGGYEKLSTMHGRWVIR